MDKPQKTITRRDFIRGSAYRAVGTACGLLAADELIRGSIGLTNKAWGSSSGASKVVLVRDTKVMNHRGIVNEQVLSSMLERGITSLTGTHTANLGWQSLFQAEDKVGIKSSSNMMPTSQALVDLIAKNVEKAGVSFANIRSGDSKAYTTFKDCDTLVNVPGLKTHWLSGIAGSIKNYINLTMVPSLYHPDSCANLGKVWLKPQIKDKTRLIVVDATRLLFNGGPQVDPRYILKYYGLILGTDPVAVDMVCLQIIQARRNEYKKEFWPINPPPKHIELADKKFHIGTSNIENIELVKIGGEEGMLL